MWQQTHEIGFFYCLLIKQAGAKGAEREGIYMIITQTQSMERTKRISSFLFAMIQVALVMSLFWAFKAHLV